MISDRWRMQLDYRVISIGTLAAHPLWDEKVQSRTGHATTTLIRAGDAAILVDPSLPAPALLARMSERTNLHPDAVTHVFLTSFERERRRALGAFESAAWLLHESEMDSARESLDAQRDDARDAGDGDLLALIDAERDILERCRAAPDRLAPGVDLFPLPGITPGCCGLLLSLPGQTVLVCGDAVPTLEHLASGQVLPHCASIEQARESFREAVEIADVLILGRDNLACNPLRRLM
jgi:glyoxylase-like metal-dependent hydrolase (beta-lactamase superfamily II)